MVSLFDGSIQYLSYPFGQAKVSPLRGLLKDFEQVAHHTIDNLAQIDYRTIKWQ